MLLAHTDAMLGKCSTRASLCDLKSTSKVKSKNTITKL